MIIKKLNTVFHKHSKVLFGAFTLIIIVSFLGFLTPGQFGCNGGGGGGQTVGEVYGKKVSRDELLDFHRKFTLLMPGGNEELSTIFYYYCLSVRADQLGIHVSDDEIAKAITTLPYCVDENGKYDKQKYQKWIGDLKKRGVGEDEVAESIRLMLKIEKLRQHVLSQVSVTPSEVESFYRDQNTKLHFRVASVSALRLKVATPRPPAPKEQELKDFYAKHKDYYRCVKLAEFPRGKDAEVAVKKAEAFRKAVNDRVSAFDAEAKKQGGKVFSVIWVAGDGEGTGGAKLDIPLLREIFTADPKAPLTKAVSGKNAVYVGCLLDASKRNAAVEAKKLLEKHWKFEQSRKLVDDASRQLKGIADKSARIKAFNALKNFSFTEESRPGVSADFEEGAVTNGGDRIYLVKKSEIPVVCVPVPKEKELKDFYDKHEKDYRCVRVAEFRDGKDANGKVVKAGERARAFCKTINQLPPEKRVAAFVADAEKQGIKVYPSTWVTAAGEVSAGAKIDGKLVGEIFAAAAGKKQLTKVVTGNNAAFVACLMDASKRNVAVEAKKLLEKHWRTEEARKLAVKEQNRLSEIRDRAAREKAFKALKGFTFTDMDNIPLSEYRNQGLPRIREGETITDGDSIYLLYKIEVPTGDVPEIQKELFRELCRSLKGREAWTAFGDEVMSHCKILENK